MISLLTLGVTLSLDNFRISIVLGGLRPSLLRSVKTSVIFGLWDGLAPAVGIIVGHYLSEKIDSTADQRFRRIGGREVHLCDDRRNVGGSENEVDCLVDFVLKRLKRYHAGLADRSRDATNHVQAAAVEQCDIEAGLKAWQRIKPGMLGDRSARLLIGDKIEMAATLRHFAECERNTPGAFGTPFGLGHRCTPAGRARKKTSSGSGKANRPRSSPSSAASRPSA